MCTSCQVGSSERILLCLFCYRRAEEIDNLVRSGEAYDDLILKCGEGQAFYQDISERLRALRSDLDQINGAIDDLESKHANYPPVPTHQPASAFSVPFSGMLLRGRIN